MANSKLIGYLRRSNGGGALKISISSEAFATAEKYTTQDGNEYVGLIVNLDKVQQVMQGDREVTGVCQITDEE